nr:isoform 2 of ankyrin-2 [Quercus suber]
MDLTVELTTDEWMKLLEKEAQGGYLDSVRSLVLLWKSLHQSHGAILELFYTALVAAARNNDAVIVEYLLDEGVPITAASVQTAAEAGVDSDVEISAAARHLSVVQFLLDRGASPNAKCELDKTPFSLALEKGLRTVVDLMLDYGADVEQGEAIHHAIHRSPLDTQLLDMLIEKGAPFDSVLYSSGSQTQYQRNLSSVGLGTQLHHAIIEGKTEAARCLIKKGSSLDKTTIYGRTALQIAIDTNASPSIFSMLREAQEGERKGIRAARICAKV